MIVPANATRAQERRPRVLAVLPDWPWPATTGGRRRAAAIIEALRSCADVTLLATSDPDGVAPPIWRDAIAAFEHRHAVPTLRMFDFAVGSIAGRHVALQRALASGMLPAFNGILAAGRPDFLILGRGFGGPFIRDAKKSGARVILEADESLIDYNRSVIRSKAAVATRVRAAADLVAAGRTEGTDFLRADEVWLSNRDELSRIHRAAPLARFRLVPNIAPATTFEPPGPVNAVGFVGFFRHPPNEEAAVYLAEHVMPAVRERAGPPELRLIGRDPTARLRALARRDGHVTLIGEVADVVPELRSAGLLAMPVKSGAGARIKALEAAAAGIPIVSTMFGMSGLSVEAGRDFLVAESDEEFANAIVELANSPERRKRLATNARLAVMRSHSMEVLSRVIRDAVASPPAPA